ncbi:leucine--tRNA ligase [Ignavibacteria bacterium]
MTMAYPFTAVESKWQSIWKERRSNATPDDFSKPKFYALDMFPYPSGDGLHVGHPEGYTATDIVARFKKMQGYNVLHPMGFDAFGLPTERYSMTHNIHPAEATAKNVANFKRQLNMLGFAYDWEREINTTEPAYYKWTQWMFLLIYNSWYDDATEKARPIDELPIPQHLSEPKEIEAYRDSQRLAFISHIPVNWCEQLGTVLANEEVDEWKEKGYTVERRPMRQWMLRITKYAERLLKDLDSVQWPNSTKEMQKHWIGKSEGAEAKFQLLGSDESIWVFTTRPDTMFGATYLVIAPEHSLADRITTDEYREAVANYKAQAALKSDLDRTDLATEKTGVFTGGYALNPATGAKIPVWIADYVLAHYGFGAIMAVPAHDERDHEFAKRFGLPISQTVLPENGTVWDCEETPFTDDGTSINSSNSEISLDGLSTAEAKRKMTEWLENKGIGARKIQYRLRDWLFSRQRYWGEPIPIMYYEDGSRRALDSDELPLLLPDVSDFKPAGTGESPLANVEKWVNFIDKKTGRRARYETNTMPQWAGSCWYYLRYCDPHNENEFCTAEKERYWLGKNGVDLYIGGAEHAVLHLLYARFWHKVLFDYGYVTSAEPFARVFHQGLILAEDGRKMSKSFKNVVNPDEVTAKYGADALRVFEMFMGPLEASKPWSTNGVEGISRFLNRVWRLVADEGGVLSDLLQNAEMTSEQEYAAHSTIKKVAEDIDLLSFNTAISAMMIFTNELTAAEIRPRAAIEILVKLIAPFAPHLAEELWSILGNSTSVFEEKFPICDVSKLTRKTVEIVLQVNSKIRSKAIVHADISREDLEKTGLSDESVLKFLDGLTVRKIIVVPGKLVNYIAN